MFGLVRLTTPNQLQLAVNCTMVVTKEVEDGDPYSSVYGEHWKNTKHCTDNVECPGQESSSGRPT